MRRATFAVQPSWSLPRVVLALLCVALVSALITYRSASGVYDSRPSAAQPTFLLRFYHEPPAVSTLLEPVKPAASLVQPASPFPPLQVNKSDRGCGRESYYDYNPKARDYKPTKEIKFYTHDGFLSWSVCFDHDHSLNCSAEHRCVFSRREADFDRADAAIFNANRLPKNFKEKFAAKKRPGQLFILWQMERLARFPYIYDVLDGKHAVWDMAITYRFDIISRHHFPFSYLIEDIDDFIAHARATMEYRATVQGALDENAPVAYVSRECRPNRDKIVRRIQERVKVDSYGKCLHTRDFPADFAGDKMHIMRHHRFCVAIENSVEIVDLERGPLWATDLDECAPLRSPRGPSLTSVAYLSEKMWDCFRAGAVPIVFGPRNTRLSLPHPTRSAIVLGDFERLEDAVARIEYLASNTTAYKEYQQWPWNYDQEWYERRKKIDLSGANCELCKHVARIIEQ